MNRVQIKLTSPDLFAMVGFLQHSISFKSFMGYSNSHEDKLILASLAELLHKLSSAQNCFKKTYTMQLNVSHGLALIVHWKRMAKVTQFIYPIDAVMVNNLIGLIDQKTIKP